MSPAASTSTALSGGGVLVGVAVGVAVGVDVSVAVGVAVAVLVAVGVGVVVGLGVSVGAGVGVGVGVDVQRPLTVAVAVAPQSGVGVLVGRTTVNERCGASACDSSAAVRAGAIASAPADALNSANTTLASTRRLQRSRFPRNIAPPLLCVFRALGFDAQLTARRAPPA
jgi:hypothetical protein